MREPVPIVMRRMSLWRKADAVGKEDAAEPPLKTVPDLRNYAQSIAVQKLEAADLTASISQQIVTDNNQVGFVVNQYPQAGVQLPLLSEVKLFVGKK